VHHVRRRYLVILGAALIGLLTSIVVPTIAHSINAANAKADRANAAAAFAHLKVPSNFRRLAASNLNCVSGLVCYYVPAPTTSFSQTALLAVLRTTGAVSDTRSSRSSYCSTFSVDRGRAKMCAVYAHLDGLYISALLRGYDPRAPRPGLSGSLVLIAPPFNPADYRN
jgi:hypothetical protein